MNYCYVVSLVGKNVFKGRVIKGVIPSISMDSIIRDKIKEEYGIEFEEKSGRWSPYHWEFGNITDNRDITLLIEKVLKY